MPVQTELTVTVYGTDGDNRHHHRLVLRPDSDMFETYHHQVIIRTGGDIRISSPDGITTRRCCPSFFLLSFLLPVPLIHSLPISLLSLPFLSLSSPYLLVYQVSLPLGLLLSPPPRSIAAPFLPSSTAVTPSLLPRARE